MKTPKTVLEIHMALHELYFEFLHHIYVSVEIFFVHICYDFPPMGGKMLLGDMLVGRMTCWVT